MKSWVYILECSDGLYYTGCTTNLALRVTQHQQGVRNSFTARRRPVRLVWSQEFDNIRFAIEAERQIKGWSHKKKEALIRGEFDLLHELAQSREMIERRLNKKKATSQ